MLAGGVFQTLDFLFKCQEHFQMIGVLYFLIRGVFFNSQEEFLAKFLEYFSNFKSIFELKRVIFSIVKSILNRPEEYFFSQNCQELFFPNIRSIFLTL